ncbi:MULTISPECIES: ABC transporter permease [unclassified Clostridium]|uniref:ABC transporter permease n=1 Tax=Clostridium TaxID=1485 RepID=UPI001C8C2522|nr:MULTISPECIES: ABC transporter permease [unclassified Clostridium]MBX9138321.1 ABC transporter permease [Clostridium sp. K12(2020)]MBX9145019.1 ABC transporter permease [Clostridium sp. K13]MDU2292042.1 ABC transporter permease [Clostridium celatum]MDU4324894.1 ABC transporter permease [Clostridium celatum]
MYFKLASKNLKKSIKDYTIYFLTLVFGICIFYTFNSIESQRVMMDLSEIQAGAFQIIDVFMSVASVFISFILGFLIVYANNYLIKRRKKEFGIYMTLGMENKQLSRIIFVETILIGLISLAVGIGIGTILSQGLSIFTAKLFKVKLVNFTFVFSKLAFVKTVMCFGLIYLVVLIFNSFTIRKVKLIDLLTSAKKNEKLKVKNIWVSVIVFLISVAMIGAAYYLVIKNGIAIISPSAIGIPVLLGSVGTILFFFSLSGFLLKVMQSNKKFYLKDLNMFILRQINSKINTTFISMSFICLMLFVAICTFSSGLGISRGLNKDVADLTQFDATLWNLNGDNLIDSLGKSSIDSFADYAQYTNYDSKVPYSKFLTSDGIEKGSSYYPVFTDSDIMAISLTDFNNILRLLGKDQVSLKENEYLAFTDIGDMQKIIQESINDKTKININGKELIPADIKVLNITSYDSTMKSNICTFVVNDDLVNELPTVNTYLNVNYKDDKSLSEIGMQDIIKSNNDKNGYQVYYINKETVEATTAGLGAMVSYLAIYMGIIFLITSAAVLALQQLCESADNTYRYELLKKVGVDEKIINKSLLTQIGIYFMMPLSIALVHSIVGLKFAQGVVSIVGDGSMMKYILITLLVLVIVYGGYFMATYNGAKKIIR